MFGDWTIGSDFISVSLSFLRGGITLVAHTQPSDNPFEVTLAARIIEILLA